MTETKTAKVTPVAEMQQTKAKQIKHLPAKRETPAKSKSVAEMQQAKAELVQTTWAKRVKKHWDDAEMYAKKSAEAFLACGDCLLQAKEAMDPDAFTAMIRVALPFDESRACRLMQIASNQLVRDNIEVMPRSFTVLHMVSRLDLETFTERLEDGTITPDASAAEVSGTKKSKHQSDGGYARGVPGKGSMSSALPVVAGDKAGELAAHILAAAIEFYRCFQASEKVDAASLEEELKVRFAAHTREQRAGLLEGFRYATEWCDVLNAAHNDNDE